MVGQAPMSKTVWTALALFVLVLLTHYGYDPLAKLFDEPKAARRLFYTLRGAEGAVLFVVVGILSQGILMRLASLWGLYEESQTTVCQLAEGIDHRSAYVPFQGLCGSGWYAVGLVIAFCLACAINYVAGRPRGPKEG